MKVTFLQNIKYSKFHLWDVKRYNNRSVVGFDNAVLLKDILKPFKQTITKNELVKNGWTIISKINFHGKLFLRDCSELESYKGKLNLVPEDSIIYSKINVRHGCVYYHKEGEQPFGVSSEYPTFTFDKKKVNGEFLKMVLRSEEFKKLLNTKTSGISKARVKVDEFLSIQIPLPVFSEQKRIVDAYSSKIKNAKEQLRVVDKLEKSVEEYMYQELGIERELEEIKKVSFKIISYSKLNRWDFKDISNLTSKYPIKKIKNVLKSISTGTTPPTSRKEYFENGTINFYTPADLGEEMHLENSERKVTQIAFEEKKARLFKKGTLLFVGIGSTIGKVGIISDDFATSNQQITGLEFDKEIIDLGYIYYFFKYFKHITIKEKTQATIPIVNQDKIQNIPVPLPEIEIQKRIAENINGILREVRELKTKAQINIEQAIKEFENEIFEA